MSTTRIPVGLFLLATVSASGSAQSGPAQAAGVVPATRAESVTVTAGTEYAAGGFHNFLYGSNYRVLWTTPIRAPVLDLRTFAGGLRPAKKGGGMQTESLRLYGRDGEEYAFRTVDKRVHLPPGMAGAYARSIFTDQNSSMHPAAALVAAPLLQAAGVMHASPQLFVMPHDTLLGEFAQEFGGRLGLIEQYPGKAGKTESLAEGKSATSSDAKAEAKKQAKVEPTTEEKVESKKELKAEAKKEERGDSTSEWKAESKGGEKSDAKGQEYTGAFAGAVEIIDSDTLRKLLDRDPRERVDARAMLTARLMDLFLNDIDRHPGQWKWARMQRGHASPWVPIPRDRDQAFVSYSGAFLSVARLAAPNLVRFDGTYSIPGLTHNSLEMDRRLLGGLERSVWDSIAAELTRRLTDQVIDAAVNEMPAEYRWSAPAFAATLKLRRDRLRAATTTFYLYLAGVVDVHGTDAADRLTVTRAPNGIVEVRLESGGGTPFFLRRFDARETHEIRIYLHGGNDTSSVVGDVRGSIPVKIIGGNGTNWLTDSSRVDGEANPTQLIDVGTVTGVEYGKDTLFDRLPWVESHGKLVPPGPDRGSALKPIAGISDHKGLGLMPHFGIQKYSYGFRDEPYSSVVGIDAQYAFAVGGLRLAVNADKRWGGTPFHIEGVASVSQFEELGYHGLGNATDSGTSGFYDVRQRQWRARPALAFALGPTSDLSFGPVIQYTTTDSAANRFISSTKPYGFGKFGEVGVQLGLHHEMRDRASSPRRYFLLDVDGTVYPAMWDVTSPFERVSARAGAFITLPIVTQPVFAIRAGADKLYGAFPYFESAFLGGNHTLRRMDPQRYAGDASLYASSELRVPLWHFAVMVPMNAGVIGTAEGGRVYVGSASPGGWHTAAGGGLFIGLANQKFLVSCTVTNEPAHRGAHCQTGLTF